MKIAATYINISYVTRECLVQCAVAKRSVVSVTAVSAAVLSAAVPKCNSSGKRRSSANLSQGTLREV